MTESKHIRIEKASGVVRITFDRPKHNVLHIPMMDELNHELESLAGDHALKCVVFFGEGPSWCAGVEVGDHKPEMVDRMMSAFNRIFKRLERMEVPTIAAVHGACLGGGMEVAIACDMVVASDNALFGQPEIKLGFLPPYAAIRLPQLVGVAKAIEICTTGRRYSAEDAKAMGFVSTVVKADAFAENVERLIDDIKYNSPLIIRLNKRAVKQHLNMGFSQALDSVSDLFLNTLMKTGDTLEGIASFEEKRKPVWKNE